MSKLKNKIIILLVVTFMLFSSASCSKNRVETKNSIATGNTSSQVIKPEKIVAMLDEFNISQQDGRQQLLDKYKQLTGITLDIVQYPHNMYYDKVNLSFASGKLPDVVELSPSRNNAFITYFSQEALYDMTQDVAASDILSKSNPALVDSVRIDGLLYGFPKQLTNHTTTYIRKDWLDKSGLPIPSSYSQYLDILKAFTYNDVDNNGKNDTIGFTGTTNYKYLPDFMQDAVADFQYKNGKWVDGFQQPEMKSALERIQSAYNEGLIDKEIVTNNDSTATNKFINGQAGTITYWANAFNMPTNAQQKIIPLPAMQQVTYINSIPDVYAITSASENPKGVFKYFIEYMHDGDEGQNLFTYGVEGLTYEIKETFKIYLNDFFVTISYC